MKVGIIGAGAAGLCAIKHSIAFGCEAVAFEQCGVIGGTWVYSESTGTDDNGYKSNSNSMYEGLRTNLPKELMQFPDFPFPPNEKSYLPAGDVNDYLDNYADTFELRKYIKLNHQVLRVRPVNGEWELIALNYAENKSETFTFDIVLVCNGHFSVPDTPTIEGRKLFLGNQMHSHNYRTSSRFVNKKVLTIGAGPSGVDISQEVARVATQVFWSNHLVPPKTIPADNLIQKADVLRLTRDGAEFTDGTCETFDEIIYCTGYKTSFPFLSVDCEVLSESNYVRPLFKHCLSINQPSLGIIGLPFYVCPFQMFDLQVRFCLTFMTGRKELPAKQFMIDDTKREMEGRWQQGMPKKKAHSLGVYQGPYFAELARLADIVPVKPVILSMYSQNRRHQLEHPTTYRDFKFSVLDDELFKVELLLRDAN